MPTPQVPFFLKNPILEEAHHSWAQYSICTATLAVDFHRKPWTVNWSWHISFGHESSTVYKTRSIAQKSTSCDTWYSMPYGKKKEGKNVQGFIQEQCCGIQPVTLLCLAHIFIVMRLSSILISYWASYNKPLQKHAENGFLRSPQLGANPSLHINCTLVRFVTRLTAFYYTK